MNSYFVTMILFFIFQFVLKTIYILPFEGPVIIYDEIYYKDIAYNLYHYKIYFDTIYPPLYPVSLLPAFISENNFYTYIKILNSFYSSLSIIAAWFLGKKFLSPLGTLIFSIIVGILPFQYVFPTFVMSENLYYPLFLIFTYVCISTVQTNRIVGYAIAGFFFGLLILTRYFGFIYYPIFLGLSFIYLKNQEKFELKNYIFKNSVFLIITIFIAFPFYYGFNLFNSPITKSSISSNELDSNKTSDLEKTITKDFKINISDQSTDELINQVLEIKNFEKMIQESYSIEYLENSISLINENQLILKSVRMTRNQDYKVFNNRIRILKNIYSKFFISTNQPNSQSNYLILVSILNRFLSIEWKSIVVHFFVLVLMISSFLPFLFFVPRIKNNFIFNIYLVFQALAPIVLSTSFYSNESVESSYFSGRYIFFILPLMILILLQSVEIEYKNSFFKLLVILIVSNLTLLLSYFGIIEGKLFKISNFFILYNNTPDLYPFFSSNRVTLYLSMILSSLLFIVKNYSNFFNRLLLPLLFLFYMFSFIKMSNYKFFPEDTRKEILTFINSNPTKTIYNETDYSNGQLEGYLSFKNVNDITIKEIGKESDKYKIDGYLISNRQYPLQSLNSIKFVKSLYFYNLPFLREEIVFDFLDKFNESEKIGKSIFSAPWNESIALLDNSNIFMIPNTKVVYQIKEKIQKPFILSFGFGFHPLSQNWKVSDGALGKITITTSGKSYTIFKDEVLPEDQLKIKFIDLSNFQNKEIIIEFSIFNKSGNNENGDWLIWQKPVLFSPTPEFKQINKSIIIPSILSENEYKR